MKGRLRGGIGAARKVDNSTRDYTFKVSCFVETISVRFLQSATKGSLVLMTHKVFLKYYNATFNLDL